ncbi:MAG: hypothetical protein FWC96_08475 [Oscillospiraceae bacterium]|nr:hypothetical protein [Oscillospiraceae bacterium]
MTVRRFLAIAFVVFAAIAVFLGNHTNTRRQRDLEQHAVLDHAAEFGRARLPQAREFFAENRTYLDYLAASEELHAREVAILPHLIVSSYDEAIWRGRWDEIPWLAPHELHAALTLVWTETEGARDISIVFYENSMTYTLFGTPLHAHRTSAWVAFRHGDNVAWPGYHVVNTESLGDGWHLTLITYEPLNSARPFLIATIILSALSLASLGVLIWSIKTYRFLRK